MVVLTEILTALQESVAVKADMLEVSLNGKRLELADSLFDETEIHDLTLDSRQLKPRGAFAAINGTKFDGRDFIEFVDKQEVSVIFYDSKGLSILQQQAIENAHCVCVGAPDLHRHVSLIASVFFGYPSQSLQVYGITGTNGKTSCAYLLSQSFNFLGHKTAFMGTIGNGSPEQLKSSTHTTLDAVALQAEMAEFVKQGYSHVCVEISSHALDQYRAAAVNFYGVLFTNLSQDHLDYHVNMQSYAAAKKRLFTDFKPVLAVINVADQFGKELASDVNAEFIVTYGDEENAADVIAEDIIASEAGLKLMLECQTVEVDVHSSLIGLVNVPNIALVGTVLLALGVELNDIEAALKQCHSAPGRMELFSNKNFPKVVVDFAHTPEAIKLALLSCRVHCQGELWIVFGCGGDRDQSKRPIMGEMAELYADRVMLCSDNPRSEQPEDILKDIVAGMSKEPIVIEDRAKAVSYAIEQAKANDLVLIAGKGHEEGQIVGPKTLPYSDREWTRKCLGLAA